MTDWIDLAVQRTERERARLIARCQAHVQHTPAPGPRQCIDCGCDIDPRRLAAVPGALRCVSCASAQEGRDSGRMIGAY